VPAARRVIDVAREIDASGRAYAVVDEAGRPIGAIDRAIVMDVLLDRDPDRGRAVAEA
jgi:hypothetical protein